MALQKGRSRRRNCKGDSTKAVTLALSKTDSLWIGEQAAMRVCSESLIVAEAIDHYREKVNIEVAAIEKEERRDKALAKRRPDAPEAVEL